MIEKAKRSALIDAGLIGYMFELKSFWKLIQQLEDPQDFVITPTGADFSFFF
jgi:hypothetical protein